MYIYIYIYISVNTAQQRLCAHKRIFSLENTYCFAFAQLIYLAYSSVTRSCSNTWTLGWKHSKDSVYTDACVLFIRIQRTH